MQCWSFHFVVLAESNKSEVLCALASAKGQRISACSFWNFPSLAALGQNVPYAFPIPCTFVSDSKAISVLLLSFLFLPSSPQQLQSKVGLVHVGFSLMLLNSSSENVSFLGLLYMRKIVRIPGSIFPKEQSVELRWTGSLRSSSRGPRYS